MFDTEGSPFLELETIDFTLENWLDFWYPKICEYLDIDAERDEAALISISEVYQSNVSEDDLRERIEGKEIVLLAPGVKLEEEFNTFLSNYSLSDKTLICADGATSFLVSKNIIPDIITSDIDGKVEDQILAQEENSILLLHVHGDNTELVGKYIETISERNFLITTQSQPVNGTFNFLGFTDGDRALCLSSIMNARSVTLLGFDFGEEIGEFSKAKSLSKNMKERKMKKFTIAKSIINWCASTGLEIKFT
jgi:uncharacterized Rossmann fold enzyme